MMLFGPRQDLTTEFHTAYHVLDSMADLVSILDADGRYVYANAAMVQKIGRNPVGTTFDDAANHLLGFSSVPNVRHTKTPVTREERIEDAYFSVTTSPILDEHEEIQAFVEVYHDISAKINLTIADTHAWRTVRRSAQGYCAAGQSLSEAASSVI